MKCRATDAQVLCRLADVAPRLHQGVHHGLALGAPARLAQGGPVVRRGIERKSEIAGLDDVTGGHDDGALHGVVELADVARPAVPADGFERGAAEAKLAALLRLGMPPEERV